MKSFAPELAVIVTGMVLLSVGLAAWLGWERAAVVVGAALVIIGAWSAASERGGA